MPYKPTGRPRGRPRKNPIPSRALEAAVRVDESKPVFGERALSRAHKTLRLEAVRAAPDPAIQVYDAHGRPRRKRSRIKLHPNPV